MDKAMPIVISSISVGDSGIVMVHGEAYCALARTVAGGTKPRSTPSLEIPS